MLLSPPAGHVKVTPDQGTGTQLRAAAGPGHGNVGKRLPANASSKQTRFQTNKTVINQAPQLDTVSHG